jgi:hypothetical protein
VAQYFTLRALATTGVFLVSIPVALYSPLAGKLSWLAIVPVNVSLARRYRGRIPADVRPSI